MTYATWLGGTGRLMNASNWSGGVAPASGDTAEIDSGTVVVHGKHQGVDFSLEGTGGAVPTLRLQNSSVSHIQVGGGIAQFPEAGKIAVRGWASVDSISEGGLRAQPGDLTVKLGQYATFANVGSISVVNGSTLTEVGGPNSAFENDGSIDTWGSTNLTFGSNVTGTGTIANGDDRYGLVGGKIEFGAGGGSGQAITLDSGTLQLDQPMQFQAVIAHLNADPAPAYDPTRGINNGAIVLASTYADNAVFSGTELVLTQGCTTVADLHFSGLPTDGTAQLWVGSEPDGSTAVTGFALPGSQELHVSATPVALS